MPRATPPKPRTFQDLLLKLQCYWAERGCVILQPYDMEVGAGTFHTATFLRAVGPEPWSAAYVQPSRRPADGRYGENPFRLQHYYQYQVVIKPSPPVGRTTRRLHVRRAPRLGSHGAQERGGVERPAPTSMSYGCRITQPRSAQ